MKKTNKLAISSAIVASLILTPVAAFADGVTTGSVQQNTTNQADTATTTTVDATAQDVGMTPDAFFYFLKELARDLNLWTTFDDQKKADLYLQYANEKAAELNALSDDKKKEYTEEQMKQIEELLKDADKLLTGTDGDAAATTSTDATGTVEASGDDTAATTTDATATSTDATATGATSTDASGTVSTTTTAPTDAAATGTVSTTTTTEQDDQEAADQDGKMGPEHALVVLKALLEKLPEPGRKGVENAIKHLEQNIAKHNKKKHKEDADEQQQPTTGTEANGTTASTTTDSGSAATTTSSTTTTGTASTSASTTTSATAPAQAPATVQANPDLKLQVKTGTTAPAPAVKEHHDNGLHLGQLKDHDKQDNNGKKENEKDEHGKN